jgi:hypothetical protein
MLSMAWLTSAASIKKLRLAMATAGRSDSLTTALSVSITRLKNQHRRACAAPQGPTASSQ